MPSPAAIRIGVSRRLMDALLRRSPRQGGVMDRWAQACIAWHLRMKFDRPDLRLISTGASKAMAQTLVDPTPLAARRLALGTVTEALRNANVPFFCVRGYDDLASAVAVNDRYRKKALTAIRHAAQRQPLFVSTVTDRDVAAPLPGTSTWAWETLQTHPVIRVTCYGTDEKGHLLLDHLYGCDLEFWRRKGGRLRAPRPNRLADVVRATGEEIVLDESQFTRMAPALPEDRACYPTRAEFVGTVLDDITFPVDVVYTWVDGTDPAWQARRDRALAKPGAPRSNQSANASRFISHSELRYSMRSLHMFAPWVRHIWLVTDDQVPSWLDTCHPHVTLISHKAVFKDRGFLPTFNSHAIESQLHHIDGLAEHFIYFNDDVFVGRPLTPHIFFQANGITKLFPSKGKVDPGDTAPTDLPTTAAGKNNRELIKRDFGRHVTFKMKHVPHALRRSVLAEMTQCYAEELARTARNQFRDPTDISLVSSAYQYYALMTGRASVDKIANLYVDMASAEASGLLEQGLSRRNYDVLCLNDVNSSPDEMQQQQRLMDDFLSRYFPAAAPWELADQAPTRTDSVQVG